MNIESGPVAFLPQGEPEEPQHGFTNMSVKKKTQLSPAPPDFLILKKHLENAALQQNNETGDGIQFTLYSNGSSGGNKCTRRFNCAGCVNRINTKRHMALAKKRQDLKHTSLTEDGGEMGQRPMFSNVSGRREKSKHSSRLFENGYIHG
jgi:hypothetical protein